MKGATQRRLAVRLVGAVAIAFAASLALTWMLHERLTRRDIFRLIDNVFSDVAVDIRERVDARMFRQAMAVRDKVYEMQEQPWWSDPDESSRRLRALADELGVDEICIADADGMLSHSARRDEVGALNFVTAEGQAHEFASLLNEGFELSQPLLPNSLRGEMVKYVGVWMPEGGFVLVGAQEKAMRNLARSALTGLTHGWHVSGDEGGIFITTDNGTIISHPIAGQEGGQWRDPGAECYWEKRVLEGFPVYVVIPKHTAVVERRVLIATSAFLNGMALVLAESSRSDDERTAIGAFTASKNVKKSAISESGSCARMNCCRISSSEASLRATPHRLLESMNSSNRSVHNTTVFGMVTLAFSHCCSSGWRFTMLSRNARPRPLPPSEPSPMRAK